MYTVKLEYQGVVRYFKCDNKESADWLVNHLKHTLSAGDIEVL